MAWQTRHDRVAVCWNLVILNGAGSPTLESFAATYRTLIGPRFLASRFWRVRLGFDVMPNLRPRRREIEAM